MTKEQYAELVEQVGKEAATEIKKRGDALEIALNTKYDDVLKESMTKEEFKLFKETELKALNELIAAQNEINKTQGEKINELLGTAGTAAGRKSLDEFLETLMPRIKQYRAAGAGVFEVTSEEMRKAGVISFNGKAGAAKATSISGSVTDMDTSIGSPYLPGLGGSDLELFDIVRNPNFITNRVDVGRTNQSRLAWINETEFEGTVGTNILESGLKPEIRHKFKVEYSIAKKAAAYMVLTEEFEEDVPGLATAVRRMLQADVMRAFDDAIQVLVIAAARPYEITGLDASVPFTTLFDAVGALLAQIGFYNFVPNTVALNPVTTWRMLMDKDTEGRYLNPPFIDRINRLLVEANKVAVNYGLAGDLSQYKVDIYKEFTLRIGWINEQFIHNEFCILGEIRYHAYISDARKKAIVYNQLLAVQSKITSGS